MDICSTTIGQWAHSRTSKALFVERAQENFLLVLKVMQNIL